MSDIITSITSMHMNNYSKLGVMNKSTETRKKLLSYWKIIIKSDNKANNIINAVVSSIETN